MKYAIAGILEKFGEILFGIPLFYLCFRLMFGGLFWLIEGFWRAVTPCISLNLMCPQRFTGLAGLDKIIGWLGNIDIFFSLLILFPIGLYISIKASDWKSNLEK